MNQPQQENPPEIGARHRVRDDLKAYVDGELSPLRRWRTERHVRQCAVCCAEVQALEQISRVIARLDVAADSLPRPELRARILGCLPAQSPLPSAQTPRTAMSRPPVWSARGPRLAFGSVGALMLFMAGAFALRHAQRMDAVIRDGSGVASATPQAISLPETGAAQNSSRRVVAIFTSPKESFPGNGLPDAAGASMPSPSPVETGSAAAPGAENASAYADSSPSASVQPREDAYTDPTSRAAERLIEERMRQKSIAQNLQNRRPQAAAVKKPLAPLSQQPSTAGGMMAATAPAQIALAVPDVSEAHRQLQEWAQAAGAKLSVVTPNKATSIASANLPSAGKLLELRVPAQSAESLKANLIQLGTPLAPSLSGNSRPDGQFPRPSEMGATTAWLPPPPSMLLDKALHSGTGPFVTIRVQLLPDAATPR